MSYQVLARKWRPRTFATLVGQDHVVRALTHALEQQRLHHAYLFTGTRGVGKTTIARILAKALNCEPGITATPCGECASCMEIDAGRFVDLIEVDAATNTKVDEMRQLLENSVYAPSRGRFKVYVIDEVHMLSNSAFNAMLKTLEEPPQHVKFVLATTDPQKIPVTVLSRCLQFNLKQMAPRAIVAHLQRILAEECVEAEPEALRLLAQSARGSMRDALSLLDQAIAYAGGGVTEAAVRGMLGSVDHTYLFRILEAIAAGEGAEALAIADELDSGSASFEGALTELAQLLHRIALAQTAPGALAEDLPERDRVLALAQVIDRETVQLYYQISVHARQELPLAPDEYAGFTMALMRMLAFLPDGAVAVAAQSPAPAERQRSPGVPSVPLVPASIVAAPPASSIPQGPPAASAVFDGDWPALVKRLPLAGRVKQLAERSELASFTAGQFDLVVPAEHKALADRTPIEKLQSTLGEYLGRRVSLNVRVGSIQGNTVNAQSENERKARQEQATAQMHADPFVQALVTDFAGRIEDVKSAI